MGRSVFDDDSRSWDRREDESERAYQAFKLYLDLGEERTFRKAYYQLLALRQREQASSRTDAAGSTTVGQKPKKPANYFWKWTKLYDWKERALEWDREIERISRKQKLKDIEKTRRENSETAKRFMAAMTLPLVALTRKYQRNPQELEGETLKELFKLSAIGARRIPGLINVLNMAEIGGDGRAPNEFEEAKESNSQEPFVLVVPESNDGKPPCETDDVDTGESDE